MRGGAVLVTAVPVLAVPVLSVPVLPVLVTVRLGTDAGGVFTAGWLIAVLVGALGAVALRTTAAPAADVRTAVERGLTVVVPVVVVVLVGAPWMLTLAGAHVRDTGVGTTIMLALAAVPYTVVLAGSRVAAGAGRYGRALTGPVAVLLAAAVLGWLLMPALGVLGAGFGWLVACTLTAVTVGVRGRTLITRPVRRDS